MTAIVALVTTAALTVACLLTGHPASAIRVLAVGAGGAVTALVLQLPWSTELLQGDWYALGGMRGTGTVDFLELLRFDTGPVGASPLGYLIPIVALLPF